MQDDVRQLVANWSRDKQNAMKSSGLDLVKDEVGQLSETRKEGAWSYQVAQEGEPESYVVVLGCDDDAAELVVPNTIEGLPVKALGRRAFQGKRQLEHLMLPDSIETLDVSTFTGCASLKDLHLPASLVEIPPHLLTACPLESVRIPRATRSVANDAFNTRALRHLEVDKDNASYSSDGVSLFDASGQTLIHAFVSVEEYELPNTCAIIGSGAFKSKTGLKHIKLGKALKEIGDFAFFHAGLEELDCPDSLVSIGDKAFAGTPLARVRFNDGLQSIGEKSFAQTALTQVELPSGLQHLGRGAFSQLKNHVSMADVLSINPRNAVLSFDGSAFCQWKDGAGTLVEFLDNVEVYKVPEGVTDIGASAFEGARKLREVILPASLEVIGPRAFCNCKALEKAVLPDGLRVIGDSAFYNAPLSQVEIKAAVEHIGSAAFGISDGIMGEYNTLELDLSVSSDNPRYYSVDEVLVERSDEGDRALVYTGGADAVHLPDTVVEVADGAFRNARLEELSVPATLRDVPLGAFFGVHGLKRVRVSFPQTVDGHDETTLLFPPTPRDPWDTSRTLVSDDDGLFLKFFDYDSLAVHEGDVGLVVKIALSRLQHPVKLSDAARANYQSAIDHYLEEALRQFVLQEDVEGFRLVYEQGLFDTLDLVPVLEFAREQGADSVLSYIEDLRG